MELILAECGNDHDFPPSSLEVTETETGRDGHLVHVNKVACRRCGMVKATRWRPPDPAVPQRFSAIGTYERPWPADVPGLAERAAHVTGSQIAELAARWGYPGSPPGDLAPDRRASAPVARLEVALQVRAGQFALLDRYRRSARSCPSLRRPTALS
jgi:hypothetical protein